jgi:hypothetical protein
VVFSAVDVLGGLRTELVGDDGDVVHRKAAAARMFANHVFAFGLVDAVDLVAGDIALDPPIRNAQ